MNTYKKLANGDWAISCSARHESGTTVTVELRSGATKQVTLGEFVYGVGDHFVYRIADKPAAAASVQVGDLRGVLALFDRARRHLKFPAIVLSVPALGTGAAIRLNVAGERAAMPGSLTVVDAQKDAGTGRRDWFGRITREGVYQPSNNVNGRVDHIAARLREFSCDPVKVAAEHGRLTGRCCFCNLGLQDERSTGVGYGPVCARNYGLPWGDRDEASKVERKMQRAEARADREQTAREEKAKHEARAAMEFDESSRHGFNFSGFINR